MLISEYPLLANDTAFKAIYDIVNILGYPVYLSQPDSKATFPCLVLQKPLKQRRNRGAAWIYNVSVEVWADMQFAVMPDDKQCAEISTEVEEIMAQNNFRQSGDAPSIQDLTTRKWRWLATFEARWNAIYNVWEQNN